MSELVRRAVEQAYGREGGAEETWFQRAMRRAHEDAEREPRMTWVEFFARPGIKPNKDAAGWDYDPLFDDEWIQELEDEMDRHSSPGV